MTRSLVDDEYNHQRSKDLAQSVLKELHLTRNQVARVVGETQCAFCGKWGNPPPVELPTLLVPKSLLNVPHTTKAFMTQGQIRGQETADAVRHEASKTPGWLDTPVSYGSLGEEA